MHPLLDSPKGLRDVSSKNVLVNIVATKKLFFSLLVGCALFASTLWTPQVLAISEQSLLDSSSSTISVVPKSKTLQTTEASGNFANADANSAINQIKQQQANDNMLEEVWTLVDKYYLDRSKLSEWASVKTTFASQYASAASPSQQFDVVANMIRTLGDKYSRMVSQEQYTAIQRFDLIGVGVTLMPDPIMAAAHRSVATSSMSSTSTSSSDETTDATTLVPNSTTKHIAPLIIGAPPIPGSAAAEAGLKMGDVVVKVNGISTQGRTALDVVDQLANSKSNHADDSQDFVASQTNENNNDNKFVVMTIVPKEHAYDANANDFARTVKMQRSFVKVNNPIRYKLTEERRDGTKVGFIRILEFNSLVQPNMEIALRKLRQMGANAYVIDIRQNTGGAFQSAVEISSLFLPGNQIATIVIDNAQTQLPFKTSNDRLLVNADEPVVIWMDDRSASASEVLAGSLHDNCRAVLMGKRSFGKGLIQAVYGLKSGAGLILTVARYTTPNGQEIQGTGLQPDIAGQTPWLIPGFSTDTSKVDFDLVRKWLAMCEPPSSPSTLLPTPVLAQ